MGVIFETLSGGEETLGHWVPWPHEPIPQAEDALLPPEQRQHVQCLACQGIYYRDTKRCMYCKTVNYSSTAFKHPLAETLANALHGVPGPRIYYPGDISILTDPDGKVILLKPHLKYIVIPLLRD